MTIEGNQYKFSLLATGLDSILSCRLISLCASPPDGHHLTSALDFRNVHQFLASAWPGPRGRAKTRVARELSLAYESKSSLCPAKTSDSSLPSLPSTLDHRHRPSSLHKTQDGIPLLSTATKGRRWPFVVGQCRRRSTRYCFQCHTSTRCRPGLALGTGKRPRTYKGQAHEGFQDLQMGE